MGQGQLSSVDATVTAISEFPLRFLGSFVVQIVCGLPPLSPLFQPVLQYTIPQGSWAYSRQTVWSYTSVNTVLCFCVRAEVFYFGLKGYRTGPGYLFTIALGRLCHWAVVKGQLAHCPCREGNMWHQLQLTTAGLESSAAEGPCLWLCIPAAWMWPLVCVKGGPSIKQSKLMLSCLWNSFLWLSACTVPQFPFSTVQFLSMLLSIPAVWGRDNRIPKCFSHIFISSCPGMFHEGLICFLFNYQQ